MILQDGRNLSKNTPWVCWKKSLTKRLKAWLTCLKICLFVSFSFFLSFFYFLVVSNTEQLSRFLQHSET